MSILINVIKSLIFTSTIVICAWAGLLFAMTPAVPLIFLNRRWYFRWCSFVMGSFLLMFIVSHPLVFRLQKVWKTVRILVFFGRLFPYSNRDDG